MKVDTRDLISVTEASSRGISGLVADAEEGNPKIIVRNSRPVAAVVSIAQYDRLAEIEENLTLMVAALARLASDTGQRRTLAEVAAGLGFDPSELSDDDADEDSED
jgi:prevent-host-death family protein